MQQSFLYMLRAGNAALMRWKRPVHTTFIQARPPQAFRSHAKLIPKRGDPKRLSQLNGSCLDGNLSFESKNSIHAFELDPGL